MIIAREKKTSITESITQLHHFNSAILITPQDEANEPHNNDTKTKHINADNLITTCLAYRIIRTAIFGFFSYFRR